MYPETYYQEPKKSKKKKLIIIAAIIIVVVIPILFIALDGHQKQSQLLPDNKIVTITYAEEGFTPNYLKIEKGTVVFWVNRDSENNSSLQIAANATEEKTPKDFGSDKGLGLNETYSYQFNDEGTINYRNATVPTLNGVIEVVK